MSFLALVLMIISIDCLSSYQLQIGRFHLTRKALILKAREQEADHNILNPISSSDFYRKNFLNGAYKFAAIQISAISVVQYLSAKNIANAAELVEDAPPIQQPVIPATPAPQLDIDISSLRVPYEHQNIEFKDYLGGKATIVFNMKLDDPQTAVQFPSLLEIYKKYSSEGLRIHAFPTEQGYFEPDDDETCRAKCKEYYGFGDYPNAVVFDKVDVLGPSANPLYAALTKSLPTPNGYDRITLNYEKFLLNDRGKPVRRYPRKFSAYDMEEDILALLKGEPLPEESALFQKAWREAKREAVKSEYAFRYNYNYYTAPDSMYKYDSAKDKL